MSKNLGKYVYNESELLGQGAFGKVYRGINTSTREEVAIKVQNLRNVKPHVLEAMKNEENTKCLHHPHLVKLHDVFDFEDKKIFVMELCKGDLSKTLKTRQLCETEVHKTLQQLIAGFKELVRLGLLHRDIKPANCFENNGIYKLGDFGAIVEADYTNKKLMKLQYGTMAYESPQMLNREKYSTKCDVWSLGILCFEMLYNEKPWICVSEGQYLRAMKQWPVRFPLTKKVSDQCKDFISKCLEYQEKQRMSWEEVFQHPWLHSNERTYSEIESFETEIMKQLRQTSQLGSFDPSETFKNYDIDNRGALDLRKFELFLAHFDPRITKKEISNLFSYLSRDNLLKKQEFQNIFINNVIQN